MEDTKERDQYIAIADEFVVTPEDGIVLVRIEKMGAWIDARHNYQTLKAGLTFAPTSHPIIEMPVEGIKANDALSPEQAATLLEQAVQIVIPACRVFVGEVERNYGYEEEDF